MSVDKGDDFGQTELIPLPDDSIRSIFPIINEIEYTDLGVWKYLDEKFYYLPKPDLISSVIKDDELIKQFKVNYGVPTAKNLLFLIYKNPSLVSELM